MECRPCKIVSPDAMYQRPMPSVRKHLSRAPKTTAQSRAIPKLVPATSEVTMSPAPTPVTATTMPGPTTPSRPSSVLGASLSSAAPPVTSAIFTLPSRDFAQPNALCVKNPPPNKPAGALPGQRAPVLPGIAPAGPHAVLEDANELGAPGRYHVVLSHLDPVP